MVRPSPENARGPCSPGALASCGPTKTRVGLNTYRLRLHLHPLPLRAPPYNQPFLFDPATCAVAVGRGPWLRYRSTTSYRGAAAARALLSPLPSA
jgi:hypothetical protein